MTGATKVIANKIILFDAYLLSLRQSFYFCGIVSFYNAILMDKNVRTVLLLSPWIIPEGKPALSLAKN